MTLYSMQNPVFVAYAVAASIMILKIMGQGWMTVYRMTKIGGGFLNPEDLLPGPINPKPHPEQLDRNDYVDRSRRMHRNDLENIPAFLMAGWLLVAVDPPYWLAVVLMGTFVIMRLIHAIVYATGQRHEIRSAPYTVGSLTVILMTLYVLAACFSAKTPSINTIERPAAIHSPTPAAGESCPFRKCDSGASIALMLPHAVQAMVTGIAVIGAPRPVQNFRPGEIWAPQLFSSYAFPAMSRTGSRIRLAIDQEPRRHQALSLDVDSTSGFKHKIIRQALICFTGHLNLACLPSAFHS